MAFRRARGRFTYQLPFLVVVLLSVGCSQVKRPPDAEFIGVWYLVRLNDEATIGSRIELRLDGLDRENLVPTAYRLDIRCDDQGRLDKSAGRYVSDLSNPLAGPPQDQCVEADANRQDELRRMTHSGVTISVDPDTFSTLLATGAGQTARFDYMDMTPVD